MITVDGLWRYPIKSHGRESVSNFSLSAGQTIPWDRHWAVTHEATKFDPTNPKWEKCRNFMIGNLTPSLAGIWATFDEPTGQLCLRHTDIGEITFHPDQPSDVQRFLTWVTPICPADKRRPTGIVKAPGRGMTDTDFPSVTIMTHASHKAVEAQIGRPLELERWRGNIWLDGAHAWQENDWIGREIQIGTTEIAVIEPAVRCNHTMSNPATGVRDADTLKALRDGWGHQNFGVYAKVLTSGDISLGDTVKVN